jgi:phosphatidyl-myo-inositol dimannoside synthase
VRFLVLTIDAFGGYGGIAEYNRQLITALCEYPRCEKVVAIPRSIDFSIGATPQNLSYMTEAARGKLSYLKACWRAAARDRFDLIFCTHINLLPVAIPLGRLLQIPVLPFVYGIEAWFPSRRWIINRFCRSIKLFASIRELTAKRFLEWTELKGAPWYYLPTCVDTTRYFPGRKNPRLIRKHALEGKNVILTMGRLADEPHEQRKGFDEILEALPRLRNIRKDIVYLIVGDGPDRERLEKKAEALGVHDLVIFTGRIQEEEKPDYFRLADVFAMPGSNPLFDRYPLRYVFLEALACGVPVVGAEPDGEGERDGEAACMISTVNPDDQEALVSGVLRLLDRKERSLPKGVVNYTYSTFRDRVHQLVSDLTRSA